MKILFERELAFRFLILVLLLCHAGCASLPVPARSDRIGAQGVLGSCADFFAVQDQRIVNAKALDAGEFRIKNYPYVRVNRFLASFANEVDAPEAFSDWLDRLQALDIEARRGEMANLPVSSQGEENHETLLQRVNDCGDLLKEADFSDPVARRTLGQNVAVPDEYIEARRVLGLYPLARWFISLGVSKWHDEARRSFSLEPPPDWQHIERYSPPQTTSLPATERLAALVQRDTLGIPRYTPETLEALFAIHAPVWEVETKGRDDRIGAPTWVSDEDLQLNSNIPVTYTRISYTRFKSRVLTQLNYIIWFSARPKQGIFDIYGGKLDGINYRVTLDADGAPLLYETIHNCGCFYKAFPTRRIMEREQIKYAEKPLILKAPAIDPTSESMVVSITSREHYVQHFYTRPREMQPENLYHYRDYQELRSLTLPNGGRKSMFNSYGIVWGTERLERLILWPSGVDSPGAMREWGRHAVALVGKRHFDDPFYLENIFEEDPR